MDTPDGRRKIHTKPIPRLGGLAIFIAFNLTLSLLFLHENVITHAFRVRAQDIFHILLPGWLMFFIGLYDDLKGMAAKKKLAFQILAATTLYYYGFKIAMITNPFGGVIDLGILSWPITVLWVVGITNAFNLIDGMDGLAGGIAFFGALFVFFVSLVQQNPLVSVISATMAGAALGFLKYNFNPARIFMGDCGSYFLGFILSALAMFGSIKSSMLVSVSIPVLLLGLPILDTLLAVARRFLEGKPIFAPDQQHIHHRLLRLARSQRFVVIILYGVTALLGFLSWTVVVAGDQLFALIALSVGLLSVWGIKALGYEEFEEFSAYLLQAIKSQRQTIANQIFIRKVSAEIENAATLSDALSITAEALDKLNFDSAEIQLCKTDGTATAPPSDSPNRYAWHWAQNEASAATDRHLMWEITIPLNGDSGITGSLRLSRSVQKESLRFQISSIVNKLAVNLSHSLGRFPEADFAAVFEPPHRPKPRLVTAQAARRAGKDEG
jgi:UDP-GlcNAc:undecaprenyl-phosphate GlcNAc-1-phosphate transferase